LFPFLPSSTRLFASAPSASLSSHSSDSFIIKIKMPGFSDSLISALVDSGASSNFIDSAFLSTLALTLSQLPIPIKLSLFDGEPTSHGLITHSISTNLLFPPSSFQVVDLLVTTLHPSASIVLGLPWLHYTNPDIDWTRLQIQFHLGAHFPQVPHSLAVPFISPDLLHAAEAGPSVSLHPTGSFDHPLATATGFAPPVGSDLTSATGLTPGSEVGPPHSHRTFHTPDVFTSAAVPEVTPIVSTGPELSTLSPTALRDTAGLDSDIDELHDIKHKIRLVSAAPFALLQKQGMPCYVLQICPECPDAGSDPVSSSLRSASNILSTTNLTEEESSLFNKIIPPEQNYSPRVS